MKFYIKQKVFSFKGQIDIMDENEVPVFRAKGSVFSPRPKLTLRNTQEEELYVVKRKLISILPKYRVYKGKELIAKVNKKFRLFARKVKIKSKQKDLKIVGDIIGHNFNILENSEIKAIIQKKFFKIGDAFEIDVVDGEDYAFYCALVVAINYCLHKGK